MFELFMSVRYSISLALKAKVTACLNYSRVEARHPTLALEEGRRSGP